MRRDPMSPLARCARLCTFRLTVTLLLVAVAFSAIRAADFPGPDPGRAAASFEGNVVGLSNNLIALSWTTDDDKLTPTLVFNKLGEQGLSPGGLFAVTLEDGRTVESSDFEIVKGPRRAQLAADPAATRIAQRHAAEQILAVLENPQVGLQVIWQAELRDGANYVRQLFTFRALQRPLVIKSIRLVEFVESPPPLAHVSGTVAGSPVLVGDFFLGHEHPNAKSEIVEMEPAGQPATPMRRIRYSLDRNRPLLPGKPLLQSSVIGIAPKGQMRRAFLYYLERQRPRPYRPFLHYDSWYDIAWADRKMNEKQCLAVIEAFGRALTEKRGAALDAFVFDDGWDDNATLWGFHPGFPRGFAPLDAAAKQYRSHVGVWLSPWGGYGQAKAERMKYGETQGFETNRNGFSLAGPKYYARFRDVCAEMIQKYDVNYFKFDGVGIGNDRDGAPAEFTPDIEGLLRLCEDLRRLRPDVYLSLTTGTWPSPWWLLWGDSIWRNGADCGFHGAGSMRQQWITYRDMITYRMIVRRAPLYPINSLMVQGICYAQLGTATRMQNDLRDVRDEIRMLFAGGTQLQELYVTPAMMTPPMWDALAEAAAWSRAHADVLVDVHFVGGDPGEGQPYGYASWSPRKGILALRNPGETPVQMVVDLREAFELPDGAPRRYALSSPWKQPPPPAPLAVEAGQPHTFSLAPFEALVLEASPLAEAGSADR
ncbi:MAG: hypothetical protein JXB62_13235 [Pirellulales bacterium]|nr:hypothetical protein [Pirellulales bacterium]